MTNVSAGDLKATLSEELVRRRQELSRLAADDVVRLGSGVLPSSIADEPGPADPEGAVRRALQSEREEGW